MISKNKDFVSYTCLFIFPLSIVFIKIFSPFITDPLVTYSGISDPGGSFFPGNWSIDPNIFQTSLALGRRAALDVLSGHLPLWNSFEGLGQPLLGEMQSAALFPPTWLLALPHGQDIEHALLQAWAGIGTFLFFRKFGTGRRAAVAGAVMFELNGVFAWLQNAVFNPVAFLPWLMFCVESLYSDCATDRRITGLLPAIALGSLMAALSIYAGFPEGTYLYSLLVVTWAVIRATGLSWPQRSRYAAALVLTALTALAISAPVLVAFAAALRNADLGGHNNGGFYGSWLESGTFVQYFLPYFFGPIGGISSGPISQIWGRTGGYIGFIPLLFAYSSLITKFNLKIKILLTIWIVVSIGISFGIPVIYWLFMKIPLMKITAVFRYIDPVFIFCIIFMNVLFFDSNEKLSLSVRYRILNHALGFSAIVVFAALGFGHDAVVQVWMEGWHSRIFAIAALAIATGLGLAVIVAARFFTAPRCVLIFISIAIGEMALWFLVPFLSYPTQGQFDDRLISFLQKNIGYHRVITASGNAFFPNIGSYFSIAQINYDDLPVPARTAAYIKGVLDPFANENIFINWWLSDTSPDASEKRRALFLQRLPLYAKAGVKYVLSDQRIGKGLTLAVDHRMAFPEPMATGRHLEISYPAGALTAPETSRQPEITAIAVLLANYTHTADGMVRVTVCSRSQCANGESALRGTPDNSYMTIGLSPPLPIDLDAAVNVTIEKTGGSKDFAVWLYHPVPAPHLPVTRGITGSTPADAIPDIKFFPPTDLRLAYQDPSVFVYELPDAADYFSSAFCRVSFQSRTAVDADCPPQGGRLKRLELYDEGWTAFVNGRPVPVGVDDGVFQTVALPRGHSRVEFRFAPPWMTASIRIAGIALLAAALVLIGAGFASLTGPETRPI